MFIRLFSLVVSVIMLNGCASLASSSFSENAAYRAPTDDSVYSSPSDYELPPYIRIVNLPLIARAQPLSKNAAELGDYWLFGHQGYTITLAQLPNLNAAGSYLAAQGLSSVDTQVLVLGSDSNQVVTPVYGHYPDRASAKKAQSTLRTKQSTITALADLKAQRCANPITQTLLDLCAGTPVKTLRLVEMD